VKTYL